MTDGDVRLIRCPCLKQYSQPRA